MKRRVRTSGLGRQPQVAYRETVRKTVENAEGKFIKQSGAGASTGTCAARGPQRGHRVRIRRSIKGACAGEYIPAVKRGSRRR